MKGLEALEDIILYLNANEPKGLYSENIEVIEKVKALEIIKKKNVDIALIKECKNKSEYNIEVQCHNENLMKPLEWWTRGKLTQEEFNLLREVLE